MRYREYLDKLRRDPEYVAAEQELKPVLDLADDTLALRLQKGWTQEELANRVGTRQANISRLENGLANPTVGLLQKLADALDADLVVHLEKHGSDESDLVAYITSGPFAVLDGQYVYKLPVGLASGAEREGTLP
jgi:transcriptional regulator with XRE-family HTH domain